MLRGYQGALQSLRPILVHRGGDGVLNIGVGVERNGFVGWVLPTVDEVLSRGKRNDRICLPVKRHQRHCRSGGKGWRQPASDWERELDVLEVRRGDGKAQDPTLREPRYHCLSSIPWIARKCLKELGDCGKDGLDAFGQALVISYAGAEPIEA